MCLDRAYFAIDFNNWPVQNTISYTSFEYPNMNFNIEVRKKQLESLNQYINSSKDKVETVLGYLGWNAKKVSEVKSI